MRRPHHNAFHDGLAANECGFFAVFEDRKQLQMGEQTPAESQIQKRKLQIQLYGVSVEGR
jgi:hypothetical protein